MRSAEQTDQKKCEIAGVRHGAIHKNENEECNRATTIVRGHARSTIQNDLSTLPIRSIELHPIATSKKLYTMGPIPPIAKLVPEKLRRFCEGLSYPQPSPFSCPLSSSGYRFRHSYPPPGAGTHCYRYRTGFSSKVRWSCHALNASDLPPLEKRRFTKRKTDCHDCTVLLFRPAGLPASQGGESGQVRKEAATTTLCECRG